MSMNLLDALLNARGGSAVNDLGQNFGLDRNQTESALAQLLPALSSGLKRNVSSESGLQSLLSALSGTRHQMYLDDPATLGSPDTVRDGNGILGHLLGSKDVSRRVAQRASEKTGIGTEILKKMLPVVASMVMGSLSKQTSASNFQQAATREPAGGLLGMLSPFLDADKDGSVADDLLGMAGKLFG
jgi:hypothetical protein